MKNKLVLGLIRLFPLLIILFLVSCEKKKWRGIIYYDKNDLSKYELVSGTYESEDECLVHTEEHLDRKGLGLRGDLECYQVE